MAGHHTEQDSSSSCHQVSSSGSEHDKHAGHTADMFRSRFWLSLLLTVPVLAYSGIVQQWFNITLPDFISSKYVPLVFSTIIFFYGGLVFIKSAINELKTKLPGMMTLISLAIVTAYVYSLATVIFLPGEGFFWELATLITIMLLGHWLEMKSISRAKSSLEAISKLLPDKAEKIVNGKSVTILVGELKTGDIVLVRPGSSVPADGVVVEGASSVNEAVITGESQPVAKAVNDQVIAGTVNQEGSLTVKITNLGEHTVLAGIMRLVKEAELSKSNTQVLADKAAFVLTIVAVIAGVLTFVIWLVNKDAVFAIERMVTVLVIACPHALGLAVPLVVSISTTLSARNGLLVRKRLALETARKLDLVLFDKTGTLTKGEHGVTDVWTAGNLSRNQLLQLTASLEQPSEHIVGKGIVKRANKDKLGLRNVKNFTALPGLGVKGVIGNRTYLAVSKRYLIEAGIDIPEKILSSSKQAAKDGKTEVFLVNNNNVLGALALADIVRPESSKTIAKLKQLGIKTAMITGDSKEVASYVAKRLKLDQFFAEVKPEDKSAKVKQLQAGGQRVAMVGDGINDAPALTQATVGLAIGAGTDVAIKSADVILIKSDPYDVVKIITISKATYHKMIQNLFWATGYNIVAIPLAAGALYTYGILLTPALGAVLMSISTVVVAVNAQLLRGLGFKQ